MLQILKAGNEIFFNLVSGLFGTVAKVYDIMLKLVQENGMGEHVQLDDISTTIYVLAGVFMLFRVVISMIQMLINPDQVTDKNAGAGKLVVRVITCIIMLMVFVPNGLVFGENGILPRLESALLASDGLISRVGNIGGEIDIIETGSSSKKSNSKKDSSTGNDKTTSNSTKKADLTCYYIYKSQTKVVGTTNAEETVNITGIYKIEFYKGTGGKNTIAGTNYTYTDKSGQRIAGKDDNGTYDTLPSPISQGNVFDNGNFTTCPKSFKQGQKYLISNSNTPTGDEVQACGGYTVGIHPTGEKECNNVGIMGGWSQLKDVSRYLNLYMKSRKNYTVNSDITFIRNNTGNKNKQRLKKTNDSSIVFAQKTASTLQECVEDKADECEEAQSEMFVTSDGDDAIVKLMDSGDLKVDLFLSVITGLGLVGYLLLLCVEVIIREFKLYLLKMIAPIAIISHVDPKDKIFGQWSKMLVSVYVDLFIKLISIGFAITLLNRVMDSFKAADGGLLVKFFYIVAILTFAKIVPTMISKIFGIDSLGGSFKDILGMGKAAAGFGAGAIVGGAVGAITGKGAGRLSGFAKGALMGAGSGAKGKIMGGSQRIAAANKLDNDAKQSGVGFFQRKMAVAGAALGLEDAYSKAKAKKQVNDDFVAKASKYEDEGINKVNKLIGDGHGDQFQDLVDARNDAKMAALGHKVARYAIGKDKEGNAAFIDKLTGNVLTNKNGDTVAVTDASERNYLNADNFSISAAEVEARVKGKEKAASEQLRIDLESGDVGKYGWTMDSSDVKEMAALQSAADASAKRAGYQSGYVSANKIGKNNKDIAKNVSNEQSVIMDQHEAQHMYSEKK